ncbi:MAG: DUF4743 domain-containing protein [Gammaproteobacteria bacterium]|nr:DUF4743 domain-containing protein [Gammaproteobacteria bacterium]
MSYAQRIREANTPPRGELVDFVVGGLCVGRLAADFAERLCRWGDVFVKRIEAGQLVVGLAPSLDAAEVAVRTAAVHGVLLALRDTGDIPGWRDEPYVVNQAWGQPPQLLMERAAVSRFGIRGYGVHLNGFIRENAELKLWVATRSATKQTAPGKLDQIVAGGQPAGLSLLENLYKECAEEAAIPRAIATAAVPVGTVEYTHCSEQNVRPDVLFCFDLELPASFVPRNVDGEVAQFELWSVERVCDVLQRGQAFKFNSALVVIDFLIRHGVICPDHPDYAWLCRSLRQRR